MFETSVVRAHTQAARGRLTLLSISVFAHSAIIVGAVAVSVASVEFPANAPDEVASAPPLFSVQIPPPLGNPNGGRTAGTPPAQPKRETPAPAPSELVAPREVPDDVPSLEPPSLGVDGPGDPNATSTDRIGVPWGTPDSTGDLDAPPAPDAASVVEERIYQPHEVKAPVLLHKVAPHFPELGRRVRMNAVVIVRCVIDRNGRVRDPQLVKPAPFQPFNEAVIAAVQQWRFQPGSRDGVAVESYLDLTVKFTLN